MVVIDLVMAYLSLLREKKPMRLLKPYAHGDIISRIFTFFG